MGANAQHEAMQANLKEAASKLQKDKAKAISLKASEAGTSDAVADLKEQEKRLEKQEEEAETEKATAESDAENLNAKKAGLEDQVAREKAKLEKDRAKEAQLEKLVNKEEGEKEESKKSLLGDTLEAQGKANAVAEGKEALEAAQSELNEMQANYEQTEMKVSQQDSGLQAKQAQVQQLKESESKAASPSSLENANAEMTEIAHQEAKESGKLKAAEAAAAQRTQEENSHKEEETKAAAEEAKKNEVLKNVEGSWETTLKANEAAAVRKMLKRLRLSMSLQLSRTSKCTHAGGSLKSNLP